jgi:hypothetical protein
MKIKIHSIVNKGDLANELIWLQVLEDVNDISYYLVCDSTYTQDNKLSNEHRHAYWFPPHAVKKGDWIALRTKDGTYGKESNNQGTTTHNYYWRLGRTIWNKDGDCAVLFQLTTWEAHRA